MGRISQYEQGQLASSVVGTPGVDTSGQQMWNTVAADAGSIATQLYEVQRYKQAEQKAIQDKIDTAARSSAVAVIKTNVGMKNDPAEADVRMKYYQDPDGRAKGITELNAVYDANIKAATDGIADPLLKSQAIEHLQLDKGSRINSMTTYFEGRQGPIMLQNAEHVADGISQLGNDTTQTPSEVFNKVSQAGSDQSNVHAMQMAYGANWEAKMRDAQAEAGRNNLAGIAMKIPQGMGGEAAMADLEAQIKVWGHYVDLSKEQPFVAKLKADRVTALAAQDNNNKLSDNAKELQAATIIAAGGGAHAPASVYQQAGQVLATRSQKAPVGALLENIKQQAEARHRDSQSTDANRVVDDIAMKIPQIQKLESDMAAWHTEASRQPRPGESSEQAIKRSTSAYSKAILISKQYNEEINSLHTLQQILPADQQAQLKQYLDPLKAHHDAWIAKFQKLPEATADDAARTKWMASVAPRSNPFPGDPLKAQMFTNLYNHYASTAFYNSKVRGTTAVLLNPNTVRNALDKNNPNSIYQKAYKDVLNSRVTGAGYKYSKP